MKKILACLLFIASCNGKHLAWVSDKDNSSKEVKEVLKQDLAGVSFTFDDGPNLAYTPKILDILKQYKLRATFFVEGINLAGDSEQAKERRALIKRMISEGHTVGNHTYDHKDLCRMSMEKAAWELDETGRLIDDAISIDHAYPVLLVRPPYGKKCKMLKTLLNIKTLTPMYWDIDPREWERDPKTHQQKTVEQILNTIMDQYHRLHNEQGQKKMIIILHDTKKVTVELLPELLSKLSKENN